MWRNGVPKKNQIVAPSSNKLRHLLKSGSNVSRACYFSVGTNDYQAFMNSGFCLPAYRHTLDCLCCLKRPQPFWQSLALHQQKRLFVSKPSNPSDANFNNQIKPEEENSKTNSVEVLEDLDTTDLGLPGAQKGGKKLAIIFTCTVCNTRAAKQFTENAYRHGVVIVQCPGCNNRHLIADNLGFFSEEEDGWNIEKGMSELGNNVTVVNNDNVLELSVEDVYGKESLEKAFESKEEENGRDKS